MSDMVKPIPHSHPVVEGIFKPRETVLTVIDLPKYLTGRESEKDEKDLFIVTNFNKMFATFRVHSVVGISRISWNDIQKPDKTISGGEEGVATGIAQTDGVLVTILDFEKIVSEIAPETGIRIEEIEKILKNAEVVVEDEVDLDKINIGCKVKIYDCEFEEELEFQIVGSTEANSLQGKISNESPVGQALIGKKMGDLVDVELINGTAQYRVMDIQRVI